MHSTLGPAVDRDWRERHVIAPVGNRPQPLRRSASPAPQAVIFDMDGVLVDWRDLRGARDLAGPQEHYLRSFDRHVLAEYRRHAIAALGAADLLDWLTACGLPLAVASSSRAE